jgi:hypothetical protein
MQSYIGSYMATVPTDILLSECSCVGATFPDARSALAHILREAIMLHIVIETYFSSSRVKSESFGTLDPEGTRHEKISRLRRGRKNDAAMFLQCLLSPEARLTVEINANDEERGT